MSLLIKTTEYTNSNNMINLPPIVLGSGEVTSDYFDISITDYLLSYSPLEEDNITNKVLTTDIITQDPDETANNKVLSMLGYNEFENTIFSIISGSLNNNCGTVFYNRTSAFDDNQLYNVVYLSNTDGNTTLNTTYLQVDESTFSAIDTNTGLNGSPEYLFGIDADDPSENTVLKLNKTGVYKINYSLYFRLVTTAVEQTFTPYVKIIRGIDNSGVLNHHSSILSELSTEPTVSDVIYYPSFIVNDATPITDTYAGVLSYLFKISGSVTINYDAYKQEYIGIFIGLDNDDSNVLTYDYLNGSDGDKIQFVANIEYIGT